MADKKCDIHELRSMAMRRAQATMRDLRAAKIPIDGEIYGDIMKMSYTETRKECSPVSREISSDQMAIVRDKCALCAEKFVVVSELGEEPAK